MKRWAMGGLAGCSLAVSAAAAPLASLDLAKSLNASPGWRFTLTQGAEVEDPNGMEGEKAPGAIRLCLSRDDGRTCNAEVEHILRLPQGDDIYAEPHFLNDVRIVHPAPGRALLLVRVASLHGANGDQRTATLLLGYDRARDMVVPVYARRTGHNNSQEIRYMEGGPLRGAMIAAEPTNDAPFAFWITVDRPSPASGYKQILRYRSATRYGDGNALAVIDSEMPNIQRRLGQWREGMPLPLPKGGCARPRLERGALWCG